MNFSDVRRNHFDSSKIAKRKIDKMHLCYCSIYYGLCVPGTFLDRFILDCFIEYTLIFLAFANILYMVLQSGYIFRIGFRF